MARPSNIPQNLEDEVLRRSGAGVSSRKISEWLKTEHGVEASHSAVNRFLSEHRHERAAATKQVIREKLQPQVTGDIEVLANLQSELLEFAGQQRAIATGANDDPNIEPQTRVAAGRAYLDAVDRVLKTTDLKLHYSGADEPDEQQAGGVVQMPADDPNT